MHLKNSSAFDEAAKDGLWAVNLFDFFGVLVFDSGGGRRGDVKGFGFETRSWL